MWFYTTLFCILFGAALCSLIAGILSESLYLCLLAGFLLGSSFTVVDFSVRHEKAKHQAKFDKAVNRKLYAVKGGKFTLAEIGEDICEGSFKKALFNGDLKTSLKYQVVCRKYFACYIHCKSHEKYNTNKRFCNKVCFKEAK